MSDRSEIDKIIQSPVKITLGGGEYEIKPLPIKQAIPWVKKLLKLFADTVSIAKLEANDTSAVEVALTKAMVEYPEQMAGLFWDYAKGLDREKLEDLASSSEVMAAFRDVISFELPFLQGISILKTVSPKAESLK